MKTAEEKILFKNCFFKLGQGRIIERADAAFWSNFWTMPNCSADVYELLTPYDILTVRDQNLPNFLLLIYIVAYKVVEFSHKVRPSQHKQLLASLRLLAKLLPFLYELPNFSSSIEHRFFWLKNFDPRNFCNKPTFATLELAPASGPTQLSVLGADLITALVKLLTTRDFSVSARTSMWEPGILSNARYSAPNPIHDSNRTEVMRVLHTLNSSAFYEKLPDLVPRGSRSLTFLVLGLPQTDLVLLTNNLANITCRSARTRLGDSGLNYESSFLVELRYMCVTYSAQLLAAMVAYKVPLHENLAFMEELGCKSSPSNKVRAYLANLPNDDLMFFISHLLGLLKFPLNSTRKSAKVQPSPWAIEAIMLIWELLQYNKILQSAISDRLMAKLVPYLAYHIFAFCDVAQHKNLVKLASYFLLYISSKELWVQKLVLPMNESLSEIFPPEFRLLGFNHSTRDFLIIQLCQTLIYMYSGYGAASNLAFSDELRRFFVPTFLEILYNIIPVINDTIEETNDASKRMNNVNAKGGLSYQACCAILLVLNRFATKQALVENSLIFELLALLLRALCSAATKNPASSRMLLFSFVQNEKSYDSIWHVIHSSDTEANSREQHHPMNVLQEDDEEADDDQNLHSPTEPMSYSAQSHDQRDQISSQVKTSDQFSLSSLTSNEEFLEPIYDTFNTSTASIPPEEREDVLGEEQRLESALRPKPPAGMSGKAREKMLRDTTLSQAWGGNTALSLILTILIPQIKSELKDLWAKRDECNFDNFFIVLQIGHFKIDKIIMEHKKLLIYDFMPDTPVDVLEFRWNDLSLGWYLYVLYWNIYNAQDNIKTFVGTHSSIMNSISSSVAVFSKLASSWSSLGAKKVDDTSETMVVTGHIEKAQTSYNIWSSTNPKLFSRNLGEGDKFFNAFGLKFNNSGLVNNGSGNDIANSLVRRLSDFRMNSRSSIVSLNGSFHPSIEEQSERPKLSKRNSVSSLHSLNTLNRTRSNTPRNSLSCS